MKNTVPSEWITLSKTLRELPSIKQDRVSPARLFRAHKNKMTFVLKKHGHIYAFGAIWPTKSKQWLEIGTVWVHPSYERQGLSSEIITTLNKRLRGRKKSSFLCCSNKNKRMQKIVQGMDYTACTNPHNSPIAKAWGKKRSTADRAILYFVHTS